MRREEVLTAFKFVCDLAEPAFGADGETFRLFLGFSSRDRAVIVADAVGILSELAGLGRLVEVALFGSPSWTLCDCTGRTLSFFTLGVCNLSCYVQKKTSTAAPQTMQSAQVIHGVHCPPKAPGITLTIAKTSMMQVDSEEVLHDCLRGCVF